MDPGSTPPTTSRSVPASTRERPLGVADVVRLAGRAVDALGLVWLEGEVTQVSTPSSGHVYFALQDRGSVLSAVMWGRDVARLRFALQAGQRLRVRGRLGVYDRDGKMQLYADFAEPAGLGAEALALEQLKQKLAAEGIFAAAKKRPLPRFPRRIGVVTSARGAAVHDIIRTVHRRMPTPILIADAAVQGPQAPHQIVMGMAMVVRAGVDLVIVGRGGGAATDLTAFNHERVVRTIARCPVPVISAIGHEVDLSLADLAADARASTPTAAAELAVPDGLAIAELLSKERRRLDRELRHRVERARQDLDRASIALHARGERVLTGMRGGLHALRLQLASLHPRRRIVHDRARVEELIGRLAAVHPRRRIAHDRARVEELIGRLAAVHPRRRIAHDRARLDELIGRLAAVQLPAAIARSRREHDALAARRDAAMRRILDRRRAELGQLGAQTAALSPLAVLDRGYAVVHRASGEIVRAPGQVSAGEALRVRVAGGVLDVVASGPEGDGT